MSDHLISALRKSGVIPVIRTRSAERASRAVEWLHDAGFRTFELTVSIDGIVELVDELSSDVGLDIGVGMVMDAKQAHTCIEAGASFIITPGIVPGVVEPCREAGVACLLGSSTPSEVMQAIELGADAVKIFPISSLGGVSYVKILKAMFPDTPLAPVGGIEIGDIASYLRAGAAFVGVGRKLTDRKALCSGDKDVIIDTAANALAQAARAKASPRGRKCRAASRHRSVGLPPVETARSPPRWTVGCRGRRRVGVHARATFSPSTRLLQDFPCPSRFRDSLTPPSSAPSITKLTPASPGSS